jgi:hypothetical protein
MSMWRGSDRAHFIIRLQEDRLENLNGKVTILELDTRQLLNSVTSFPQSKTVIMRQSYIR